MKKNILKKLGILIIGIFFLLGMDKVNAASSAKISISSSKSKAVIGSEFTVTIKISSSTGLGSWEWTLDYPTSKFKLISGKSYTMGYASNGKTYSKSYSYKFKAVGTGNGTIDVKSYAAYRWSDTSKMSISNPSGRTVKVITQKELEASYSKNNYLSSLGVSGYKLSPTFNKSTLEYSIETPSNVTSVNITGKKADSKATVKGLGKKNVSEGENRFNIVVTAQNGTKKTYVIKVNVIDPNPIAVKDILGNELIVVKRDTALTQIDGYDKKEITINEEIIPAYYNEENNKTLVGLKDNNGEVKMYIYDEQNNTYQLYYEVSLTELNIYPLSIDPSINNKYKKTTINLDDQVFEALKQSEDSDLAIIHATNLDDGKDYYYLYSSETNTAIKYINENNEDNKKEIDAYAEKNQKYYLVIMALGVETILVFVILIVVLINSSVKRKRRKRAKELDKTKEKENNNKEEKKEKINKEVKKEKKESDSKKLDNL